MDDPKVKAEGAQGDDVTGSIPERVKWVVSKLIRATLENRLMIVPATRKTVGEGDNPDVFLLTGQVEPHENSPIMIFAVIDGEGQVADMYAPRIINGWKDQPTEMVPVSLDPELVPPIVTGAGTKH